MDTIDRKIIAELQAEGRLTVTELAQRVGLSVAPCHRRLRELERAGAIRGYRAVVDPAAIGLGFEVLVQVTMDREDAATVADFERGLAQIPEVRHAERLFGDPDYLLRVATADIAAYPASWPEQIRPTQYIKAVSDQRPQHRPLPRPGMEKPCAGNWKPSVLAKSPRMMDRAPWVRRLHHGWVRTASVLPGDPPARLRRSAGEWS